MACLFGGRAQADVLTFDDISSASNTSPIPSSYAGFTWGDQWQVISDSYYSGTSYGNTYGSPSGEYAAYNASGALTISTTSDSLFDFRGASFTGWASSDSAAGYTSQSITVKGYRGGALVGSVSMPLPTNRYEWLSADFLQVDTLVFLNDGNTGRWWIMDDFTFEQQTNQAPVADAGESQMVPCDALHGATVTLDGSLSYDPDGDAIEFEWSAAAGISVEDEGAAVTSAFFPLGTHEISLTVHEIGADGARTGTFDVAYVTIEVFDNTPPLIGVFSTDLGVLSPPNHEMVPVTIYLEASDHCVAPENLLVSCEISSSQPDDSDATGEYVGDVDGSDGFSSSVPVILEHVGSGTYMALADLRAERDGGIKLGRTYSILLSVMDGNGNVAYADTAVVVPHSQGKSN